MKNIIAVICFAVSIGFGSYVEIYQRFENPNYTETILFLHNMGSLGIAWASLVLGKVLVDVD